MIEKNIKLNAFLNSLKTLLTILFPLITVPYLSRILGKDAYGKFNFSVSIVSYFILIAGLGINTYAIREGAKVRNDKKKENNFASEVFSLNLFSTILSYALLILCLFLSRKLAVYKSFILIISLNIIFITLGADWVNSIYEDYLYLTIRYIFVQIFAIIAMILFVRNENDLVKYVWIYLFAQVGANISNIFHIRRYVKLRLIFNRRILGHLSAVLILFISTVATTIYVNSDITILGILKDDASVGVYSVASKIYAAAKQIAIAGTVVTIPRLASYLGEKDYDKYNGLLKKIYNVLFSVTIPLFTGLFMVSKNVLLIIGGVGYEEGTKTLQVLCIASAFSIIAYFYAQCILIPNSKEKYFSIATVIAAFVNIVGNFIIIPYLNHTGAAITTLISEMISMFICWHFSKGLYKESLEKRTAISTICSSGLIVVVCLLLNRIEINYFLLTVIEICICGIGYIVIMYAFKNKYFISLLTSFVKQKKK